MRWRHQIGRMGGILATLTVYRAGLFIAGLFSVAMSNAACGGSTFESASETQRTEQEPANSDAGLGESSPVSDSDASTGEASTDPSNQSETPSGETAADSGAVAPEVEADAGDAGGASEAADASGVPVDFEPPITFGVECDAEIGAEYSWSPLDWSGLSIDTVPTGQKIFPAEHPNCNQHQDACASAHGADLIGIPVDVYLLDSSVWTAQEQLYPFLKLANKYFQQASIQLEFEFMPDADYPGLEGNVDRLTLVFGSRVAGPAGRIPDAFGSLPTGKAVLNDSLMSRPMLHHSALFNPGKPIGHQIGHVLGASDQERPDLLMAPGTGPDNGLTLLPTQALVLRVLGLARFGGIENPSPRCP